MPVSDSARQLMWLSVLAIPLGLSVWALLDATSRPAWAWGLAGRSRLAWIAAITAGILVMVAGLLISLYYLANIRPQLARAEDGDFAGP